MALSGAVISRQSKLQELLAFKHTESNTFDKSDISIKEIETYLEFDKVNPIELTPSDKSVKDDEGDYFKGWYEDELRRIYEE